MSAVSVPPTGSEAGTLGDIRIDENGVGVLAANGQVELMLPSGIAFTAMPIVSIGPSFGLTIRNLAFAGRSFSFVIDTPSNGGAAKLRIGGITVLVSAGAALGGVVTNVSGGAGVTPADVQNGTAVATGSGPVIGGLSDDTAGQGADGRSIVVTGTNFTPTAQVCVGAVVPVGPGFACVSPVGVTVTTTFDGPGRLSATIDVAPGTGAAGVFDVFVIDGAQTAQLPLGGGGFAKFEITDAPVVTSTDRQPGSPLFASPLSQGVPNQLVRIEGTGFQPPTTSPPDIGVQFAGAGLTVMSVKWTSSTEVEAVVSVANDAALVDRAVTVVNPDGGVSTGGGFVTIAVAPADAAVGAGAPSPIKTTTAPPSIATLDPSAGLPAARITITGTGFAASASSNVVTFAGARNTRVRATVSGVPSATGLTVTVPTQAVTGPVTVSVSGKLTNAVPFTIGSPSLTGVVPASATRGSGNVLLTLTGSQFVGGATVAFSPALAGPVVVQSVTPTQIQVQVTIGAGEVIGVRAVTVTNPASAGGAAVTLAGGFQVTGPAPASLTLTLREPGSGADVTATYLPSVGPVSVTLDNLGRCNAATKLVTPVPVTVRAQFVGSGTPPASVVFALIATSRLRGTSHNDDCDDATPRHDLSFSNANTTVQTTAPVAGVGGVFTTTLFAWDWGASATIEVTGGSVKGTLRVPRDDDNDGLPNALELDASVVGTPGVVSAASADTDGNAVTDGNDKSARDGLTNFEKYRGIYFVGPASGQTGAFTTHRRLPLARRNLFARGVAWGNDPRLPNAHCGIDPQTGAFTPDPTVSPTSPCPPFELGPAFENAGLRVWDVTASFTGSPTGLLTQLPTRSLVNGTTPILDVAAVLLDGVGCNGGENCDALTKVGPRDFSHGTGGFATFGTASEYGSGRVFQRALNAQFRRRPYDHRTGDPTRVVLAPDGTPWLVPLGLACDTNDDGILNAGECRVNNQHPTDTFVIGSQSEDLTAYDCNNNQLIELPRCADPSVLPFAVDPNASSGPFPQATKRQAGRHYASHELAHMLGVNIHTTDPTDLMYEYENSFTRDGALSPAAAALIQIHNGGKQ